MISEGLVSGPTQAAEPFFPLFEGSGKQEDGSELFVQPPEDRNRLYQADSFLHTQSEAPL